MKRIKLIISIICFVVAIWHIYIIVKNILWQRELDYSGDSLLEQYTTIPYADDNERKEKLQTLSNLIDRKCSYYAQVKITRKSDKMQTRLSFIGLLAIVLIPFFTNTKGIKIDQVYIVIIAFILFLNFYFFDIHTVDLEKRQDYEKRCYDATEIAILKISVNDFSKYHINKRIIEEYNKEESRNSLIRKICDYDNPDLSQITFYIIPITLVISIYLFEVKSIIIDEIKNYLDKLWKKISAVFKKLWKKISAVFKKLWKKNNRLYKLNKIIIHIKVHPAACGV